MANTYTQIHLHFVFAVKFREELIHDSWKTELYKYMTGIIQNSKYNHKLLAINGISDHVHLLVGFRPTQSISEFMQDVKGDSSRWINERKFLRGKFEWQQGYGAFSYSKNEIEKVINYIMKQEEHHKRSSFRDEYLELLKIHGVDYDERFIFQDLV